MYKDCTLEEVIAYRDLENEVFDFGEGPMEMEGLLGSEDVYYRMFINDNTDRSDEISYEEELSELVNQKNKKRLNRYKRKRVTKKKINKLKSIGVWYAISYKSPHLRIYRGKRGKYIKKEANKTVRRYNGSISNGGKYRKIYPYWNNLF